MARKVFDQELEQLHADIGALGARVEGIMGDTIHALESHDIEMARVIFEQDPEINMAQNKIEQLCINLIALQQPIASDLRLIAATLKMVTDVERIADQCADISEIMATYPEFTKFPTPPRILTMFKIAREMFAGAIDAFLRRDVDQARAIQARDDEVDTMFSQTILEMSNLLRDDPNLISQATDSMFIAKYIERMADHATNISEWAIYTVTGEHKSMTNKLLGRRRPLM
ncbi:MAG: phosphate signaling complex protein PhoU [Bacillota bacterium]|nr:phosphate signaling complex protein PhoU [Bacillota bacterium]